MEKTPLRIRAATRVALLALVGLWLFWDPLRSRLPFWLPLAALALVEGELVVRAFVERRRESPPRGASHVGPGPDDADLGWGTVVEDDDGLRWLPPPPRPARPRRRALTVVSVLAVAALLVAGLRDDPGATWNALDDDERAATVSRIQLEAARIAGRPATLRCDDGYAFTGGRSDALGVALPQRGLAFLHPAVCRGIHDVLRGDHRERDATAEALVVLAHEAVHLRGELREGVTECLALQEGVRLGVTLGLPDEIAARLMRRRYVEALAERSVIRAAYQLPQGCEEGGSLDVSPDVARFP